MRSLSSLRPAISPGFPRRLVALAIAFLCSVSVYAIIDPALQMQTGNPSGAAADPSNHSHYLIQRAQYAMDYNDTTHVANWVAWDYTTEDSGGSGRSPVFFQDTTLPAGFYQVQTTDYSGSGYDRGHMCPSADRTFSRADNDVTFYMSNMVPQTPDNNQGVWANFETYTRSLASAGNEILIISGPSGYGGSTVASGVAIPGYTWKIALVVPLGAGTALDRITASTRAITIKIPNIAGVRSTPWENFVTSIAQIEADTGFTFLTALPPATAAALRTVVDGQSPAGSPAIVAQPTAQTTVVGGSATFSVTATGDAPLSYQWFHDDDEVVGGTAATLTLASVQAADIGGYYVVVTNAVGSATSTAASLVVLGVPPTVTSSPTAQTVGAGSSVTFATTAIGSPTLSYQWRKDGATIGGATASSLTLGNVQAADAAGYDVVVTNSTGTAVSALAVLTVTPAAPTITGQPVARNAALGGTVSFTVTAAGTAPLGYQWRKGGTPLADGGVVSGAASATLVLTGVSAVDAADYDVVVANLLGSATSAPATLTVTAPPPAAITWNFTTAAPSSNATTDVTAGDVTQNNNNGTTVMISTTSASSGYTGVSGGSNAGAAARTGALNQTAGTASPYFEFTLTPIAGKRLVVNALTFGARSTSTGPQAYAIFTSLDGFAAPIASGTLTNNSSWSLKAPTFSSVTGAVNTPVTFRLYGYNGTGSASANTANWRIDDLSVTATTVFPPPVAPVVLGTTPADASTGVTVTDPVTVTFNEAVSFSGTWFSIVSAVNGPTAATVTGGPTSFTLTPPSPFAYNDTVTVTIFGAQVVDQATGAIHGSGNTTFTFATAGYVPPTPPTVTTQPVAQSVLVGDNATFTVAAAGTAPFTYQWRKNGVAIAGNASASTPSLTLTNVTSADAGAFSCVVSNVAGSDLSQSAALTVTIVPASIATAPTAQSATVGGSATFAVVAGGSAPFSYVWRKNGAPIPGATLAVLALANVTDADSGAYDVVVTNAAGSATSAAATLAVLQTAPTAIYWDFATATPTSGVPAGVTGGTVTQGNNNGTTALLTTTSASSSYSGASGGNNAGAAARIGALNPAASGSAYFEFTLTAPAGRQLAATAISFGMRSTGTGPQAFAVFSSADGFAAPLATGVFPNNSAWRLHAPAFTGVTTAAGGAVTFRLFGYAGTGSPGANTANWRIDDLTLTAGLLALPPVPPTITVPPVAQTATVGDTVTFTVAATGDAPFSYQWRKDGTPIAGNVTAITDTLSLAAVTSADAADYDCVVTNPVGAATSSVATLTVNKAAATVTLGDLAATYDATPHAATATTTPAGLALVLTYDGSATVPVNAGSYAVVATIDDVDYAGSASGTLTIAPASATIALGGLIQVYDGTPKGALATTTPAGLGVTLTYDGGATLPVNAGSYALAATITDANYVGTAAGTFVIARANAPIALVGLSRTYDGTPKPVTATTTPSGLPVTLTYDGSATAPTAAGTYAVAALVDTVNHTGAASGTLTIAVGSATIVLDDLAQIYDGLPKPVTALTTPAGLTVSLTYAGSATAPSAPGSYAVVATVTDPNYAATASGTLVISTAVLVRHAPTLNSDIDGSIQVLLPESTTMNGGASISGDLLVPGTPTVKLNGQPLYGSTVDGPGASSPSNYTITLNGNTVLRHVVRRTNAVVMPVVAAPPSPTGTRNVSLNSASDNPGAFATLRNLTLNGNAGVRTIPAGTYGSLTANGNSGFILGVPGAATPAVYNLQGLTLNGNSAIQIVGPVILNLASGVNVNGSIGNAAHPEWLAINLAAGGFTMNGNVNVYGSVVAPNGTVTINGNSLLQGGVIADRLTLNGNALLDTLP